MLDGPKNLIVVYKSKDEIPLNQLKKMVDTKDDDIENETIFGTEDGTVNILAWDEKLYLQNKKAGNVGLLSDKILFLGDIKGVDKLIPTLDIKFNKYGVSYGFSGKQAAIMVDSAQLKKKENYSSFLEDLKTVCNASTIQETLNIDFKRDKDKFIKCGKILPGPLALAVMFGSITSIAGGAVGALATLTVYAYGDAKTIRNQQLLYGVGKLYMNDLDAFMKN